MNSNDMRVGGHYAYHPKRDYHPTDVQCVKVVGLNEERWSESTKQYRYDGVKVVFVDNLKGEEHPRTVTARTIKAPWNTYVDGIDPAHRDIISKAREQKRARNAEVKAMEQQQQKTKDEVDALVEVGIDVLHMNGVLAADDLLLYSSREQWVRFTVEEFDRLIALLMSEEG